MPQITLQLEDAVFQTLDHESRKRGISGEVRAVEILTEYHHNHQTFADGVLREGRAKLVDLLSQVPCLRNFDSSGVAFRFWWVSFEIDISSPLAWKVIRALGLLLNTMSTEMMLPTAFKPIPDEWPNEPIRWQIESTAPLLNPNDVLAWLLEKLPSPLSDLDAWNERF